jgi:hypothetical protein
MPLFKRRAMPVIQIEEEVDDPFGWILDSNGISADDPLLDGYRDLIPPYTVEETQEDLLDSTRTPLGLAHIRGELVGQGTDLQSERRAHRLGRLVHQLEGVLADVKALAPEPIHSQGEPRHA